jgi:precorrin-8X/cobalt-precorrin-8 methylmutase
VCAKPKSPAQVLGDDQYCSAQVMSSDLKRLDLRAREQLMQRTRADLCPGVLRPWVADDGLLVPLTKDLVIHPDLVRASATALRAGAPILCDATMVATGVTAGRLPAGNDVHRFLHDAQVPALARTWSTTRTAAAGSLCEPLMGGSVVAIGNAPTALFHLLEMLVDGAPRPAAIIGGPVGFIGAQESKDALISFADDHGIDVPYVTIRGRRGGSAIASSALNALASEVE